MKTKNWKVVKNDGDYYYYIMNDNPKDFDEMICGEIYSQENAQLISAAPELLAACKRLLRLMSPDDYNTPKILVAMGMAREAVKKAEETPQEDKPENKYLEIYTPLQDVQLMKKETGVDITDCVGRIISIWSDGSFCIDEENEDKTAKAKLCISIVELQLPIKINGFCDKKNLSLIDGNNYKHVWEADGNTFYYLLNPDKPEDKYLEIYNPVQSIHVTYLPIVQEDNPRRLIREVNGVVFKDCVGRVISVDKEGAVCVNDEDENKAAKQICKPLKLKFPIKLADYIPDVRIILEDSDENEYIVQKFNQ
jgi:hypothetical protein